MLVRTLCLVLLTATLGVAACRHPAERQHHIPLYPAVSDELYPMLQAKANIASFDSFCKAELHDSVPVKSYTLRGADLFGVLGMPENDVDSPFCKYKYCRAYLGYDAATGFKLFMVPVLGAEIDAKHKIAGADVMLDAKGNAVDTSNHNYKTQYVLDLNAPCPSICDGKSPLVQ